MSYSQEDYNSFLHTNPDNFDCDNVTHEVFKSVFMNNEINDAQNFLPLDENELYYISNKIDKIEKSSKTKHHQKGKKFKITFMDKDISNQMTEKKNHIGRKTNFEKNNRKEGDVIINKKEHDKYDIFNILIKKKVHSINCLIEVVNSILDFLKHDKKERFKKINADEKKKVNKKEIAALKIKPLNEIINSNISSKYKLNKDYNLNLYKKLEDDPKYQVIISFLNDNYLNFFKNIYNSTERSINLKKYNFDAVVPLNKDVKLSIDQIKTFNDKQYIKMQNDCINEYFYDGKLMFQMV